MKQFLSVLAVALLAAALTIVGCESPTSPPPPTRVELTEDGIVFEANAIVVSFTATGPCWDNGVWVDVSCLHPDSSGMGMELDNQPAPPKPPEQAMVSLAPRKAGMWGECRVTVAPPRWWQQQNSGSIPPGCHAEATVQIANDGIG